MEASPEIVQSIGASGIPVMEGKVGKGKDCNGLAEQFNEQLKFVQNQSDSSGCDNERANYDALVEGFENFPISIQKDDVLGRYLVAKSDIPGGEIILKDSPIFMSPNSGSEPTCLGCCVALKSPATCSKCGWIVCGPECEILPHHAEFECEIFSREGIKPELPPPLCFIPVEEYIKVLRGVLLSSRKSPEDQAKWKYFLALESHVELRKSIPKIHFMSSLSKMFIQETCKLGQYDEKLIEFVLGVIDVNAFRHTVHPNNPLRQNVPEKAKDIDRNATFIYPRGAMAAHGCRRNMRWETTPNGNLEMWSAEPVNAGELLTHPYVDLMLGTPDRRRLLKEQFYFDCSCTRCADPTELGTYFSSLKCPDCKPGFLLPVNPLDYQTSWKCNNLKGGDDGSPPCNCIKSSEYERDLVTQIQMEKKTILEMLECGSNLAAIGGLARILGKYRGKKVHVNHFAIVDIEYNLVRRMARVPKPTADLIHELKRLIHKFLDISVVFYPGIK